MKIHILPKIAVVLLLVFQWNESYAQQISKNTNARLNQFDGNISVMDDKNKEDATVSVNKALSDSLKTDSIQCMAVKKDSAYYANIVKKNGWWVGVGARLTDEQASHLSCYYKLSKNNSAGNWTYIEAFDGYGDPTTYHGLGTYLVNQFDDNDQGANKEWKDKLLTICKWEFIGDITGQEVVQERGLDVDGNVVFIYTPVKVGDKEYTGSYMDSWGMPVFMRTDSLGNDAGYANFVHITRDERGFEVLYTYTDRLGFPQKDRNGAYGTKKDYNDDGHQTLEASLNIVGDRMIDDWGNCGWEAEYKDDLQLKAIYYDAEWNPMVIPNTRENQWNVYGWKYEYDEWGRPTEQMAIDAEGNPDIEKTYGFNKISIQYNEHGDRTFMAYYDINGGNSIAVGPKPLLTRHPTLYASNGCPVRFPRSLPSRFSPTYPVPVMYDSATKHVVSEPRAYHLSMFG